MLYQSTAFQSSLPISGFWRRFAAFLIDSIILGIVGLLPGMFAFDFLAGLGGWGRLVGFTIGILYFGILNSSIGQGQTLGKRLVKVRVVDTAGKTIGIGQSLLRYTALSTAFFLNGVMMPADYQTGWWMFLFALLVFGLGSSVVYLAIFNRRTRQSVHDLVTGTYVIHVPGQPTPVNSIWRGHFVVLGVLGLMLTVLMVLMPKLSQLGPIPRLLEAQKAIQATGIAHTSSVVIGKHWEFTAGKQDDFSYLQAYVVLRKRPRDFDVVAKKIGKVMLQNYPEVNDRDVIIVNLVYGYDIGIATAWTRRNFRNLRSDWSEADLRKE